MTDGPQFRVVLRGYEPAQVDQRVQQLAQEAEAAQAHAEQLAERVSVLEAEPRRRCARRCRRPRRPSSTSASASRRILSLAEEEARDLVERGRALLDEERQQVADEVSRQRSDADKYADQTRSDADTEAARVLEDATQCRRPARRRRA